MDKLKWFKFTPSEWLSGRTARLPNSTQGEYIRFCCVYWIEECNMTEKDAMIELSAKSYELLINADIIKSVNGKIIVKFLNDQMSDINDMRRKNSEAGKKSALRRSERALNERSTKGQQNPTDKEYRVIEHLSISIKEIDILREQWDIETIDHVLDSIENYKHNKKYKSLFLTAKTWLKDKPKKQVSLDPLVVNVMNQIK